MRKRAVMRMEARRAAESSIYPTLDEVHSLKDEDYYSTAIRMLELEWARSEVEGRLPHGKGQKQRRR